MAKIKNKPFEAYKFIGKNCNWDKDGCAMAKRYTFDVADIAFKEGIEESKKILLPAIEQIKTDIEMALNETWNIDKEGLEASLKVINKALNKISKL